ncbi:class I SAM-dependent methyltransferase [Lentzea flaviverrucosa]|uniref:Methyltransferase domain-containing protein n=1 Tax=Lentzea flaviverrucosa TaxID=200379 RepID=A0A1H9WTR0_9PSEU|nr:class I SAM-dependent methyltransferase [Lentzea flaviverrucosa]RDI23085.1 methyltransferase family protein [Lentzea flaviverrucosa]SES37159.1 Methyltransferase domain-containing protein [Lentzea flaviverrucosa]
MTCADTPLDATEAGLGAPHAPRDFFDIKGWIQDGDIVLFDWFLRRQRQQGEPGDLLELGAFLGQSAILMGSYLADGQVFTVCDLFESAAADPDNAREMRECYPTLTRDAFEVNYLSFHDNLPRIVQASSSVLQKVVRADSCRFVHIDASHLYNQVRRDIHTARDVLGNNGVVVLDDYRSEHTPGVACATWQAVLETGLKPICVSGYKFYGTWGDAAAAQEKLAVALERRGDFRLQVEDVAGHKLLMAFAEEVVRPALPVSRHRAAPQS